MSVLGSWFRGPIKVNGKNTLSEHDEAEQLADAMAGASLIMNDDMEGAEAKLSLGDSAFHQLGSGITHFIQSLLGWEQETIRKAAAQLNEVENRAWADMKRAQKENFGYTSKIYKPGTEFQLALALAQLMGAVVGVLTENLSDSIRGFLKLRKAYITLDSIMEIEDTFTKRKQEMPGSVRTSLSVLKDRKRIPDGTGTPNGSSIPSTRNASKTKLSEEEINQQGPLNGKLFSDESDLAFADTDEAQSEVKTPSGYVGHVDTTKDVEKQLQGLSLNSRKTPEHSESNTEAALMTPKNRLVFDHGPESDLFTNTIDIFVHTGTSLCLGILLLILGMIPPAFNKLLYVVGFKGDRERGLRLLWKCTRYDNINGAIAGLILLGYYNGLLGFADIVLTNNDTKTENITGFPKEKCRALLRDMRQRYPISRLWRVEEARMLSGDRQVRAALETLIGSEGSPMKQITAITMFEKAMNAMYVHEYDLSAECFIKCIALNNWSHALYYYVAGTANVELYRDMRISNPAAAEVHKAKAMEYLTKAPGHAGKTKFMANQLPFDLFVVRKLQKWEERAKEWEVDLVDAIGVSPLEEMIYLWNGPKRMTPEDLEISQAKIEWERATHPEKHTSNLDETAVHALLKATLLRNMVRFDEARALLKTEIFSHEKAAFKRHLADDWSAPCAHYEMAVLAWFEKNENGGANKAAKIKECDEYLQKAVKWDSYVLDARVGMKIGTAVETLKIYKVQWEL